MHSVMAGGDPPANIDLGYRASFAQERKTSEPSSAPSAETRSIRATLACRTRARSSSACAAARACSRMISLLLSPAILRACSSSRFANAALDERLKVRPWRYAFRLARLLAAFERGPVLLWALSRFAAICRSVATVKPISGPTDFQAGLQLLPQSPGLKPPAPALQSPADIQQCSEAALLRRASSNVSILSSTSSSKTRFGSLPLRWPTHRGEIP